MLRSSFMIAATLAATAVSSTAHRRRPRRTHNEVRQGMSPNARFNAIRASTTVWHLWLTAKRNTQRRRSSASTVLNAARRAQPSVRGRVLSPATCWHAVRSVATSARQRARNSRTTSIWRLAASRAGTAPRSAAGCSSTSASSRRRPAAVSGLSRHAVGVAEARLCLRLASRYPGVLPGESSI